MSEQITVKDLLEYLDGQGLVLTDDDLIYPALLPLVGKTIVIDTQGYEQEETNLDLPEPEAKNILEMSGYTCLATDEFLTEEEWLNHRSGDCKCCREPDVYA